MARHTYDEALRRLLVHEGGYTNHPSDPGGPTNFGITIYDYRMYIDPKGQARDVRAMSVDQAKKIYRAKYWDVQRCDELPPGVDYAVFDYGVNSGVGRSGKVLRRLVGLRDHTSSITDEVIAAVAQRDPATLVDAMCAERMRFLQGLKTWRTFGNGWGRRVQEVRAAARKMAVTEGDWEEDDMPEQSAGIEGTPRHKETNPIAKTAAAAFAAGSAGVFTVYNWAIENPIYAAMIIQGAIALAIMISRSREEKAKPDPVPVAFDAIPVQLPPELPKVATAQRAEEAPVSPQIQTFLQDIEAKPLQKPGAAS
jgi:lysozyme family protein